MASQSIASVNDIWPNGTVVSVYPAEQMPPSASAPSGPVATTGTVASGSVAFSGLASGRRYVAWALGRGKSFLVGPSSLDQARPIRGDEAVEIREQSQEDLGTWVDDYRLAVDADFTNAFIRAIADAPLGTAAPARVIAPEGLSIVAADVSLSRGYVEVTRHPRGSIVQAKAGSSVNVFTATNAPGVFVRDLVIDGNKANVAGGNGVNLVKCTDGAVENLTILNPYNDGVILDASGAVGCSRVHVRRVHVFNPGSHGIALSGTVGNGFAGGAQHCEITDNYVENPGTSGINVSQSAYCRIVDNDVLGTSLVVTGWPGIRLSNGASFNLVDGNTVRGTSRGYLVAADAGAGDGPPQFNVFGVNSAHDCLQHAALCEAPNNDLGILKVTNGAQDVTFQGTDGSAVRFNNASWCSISGSTSIIDTGAAHVFGLLVSGTSDFVSVGDGLTIKGFTNRALTVTGTNSKVGRINTDDSVDVAITGGTLAFRDHSDVMNATGTGNLTGLTVSRKGRLGRVRFNGAVTVTSSATLKLAGGVNKAFNADDVLSVECDGTAWREVSRSEN